MTRSDLLTAARAYIKAIDALTDAPVTSLSMDDPRFEAVKETRAALREAVAETDGVDQ